MAYHIFTVPCLRTIKDEETGLISVIDIIDTTSGLNEDDKFFIPPFTLLTKWGRSEFTNEEEIFDIKLSLSGPSLTQKKVIDQFTAKIPKDNVGVTITLEKSEMEIPQHGIWKIHISQKESTKGRWKEVATLPFYVYPPESDDEGPQ